MGWMIGSAWSWLVVFGLFLFSFYFFIFGGKFAIVKRDARLDLVLVLAGPIFTSGFCVGGIQFSFAVIRKKIGRY